MSKTSFVQLCKFRSLLKNTYKEDKQLFFFFFWAELVTYDLRKAEGQNLAPSLCNFSTTSVSKQQVVRSTGHRHQWWARILRDVRIQKRFPSCWSNQPWVLHHSNKSYLPTRRPSRSAAPASGSTLDGSVLLTTSAWNSHRQPNYLIRTDLCSNA